MDPGRIAEIAAAIEDRHTAASTEATLWASVAELRSQLEKQLGKPLPAFLWRAVVQVRDGDAVGDTPLTNTEKDILTRLHTDLAASQADQEVYGGLRGFLRRVRNYSSNWFR